MYKLQMLDEFGWYSFNALCVNNINVCIEYIEAFYKQTPRQKYRIIDYNTGKVVYE
jgi:hypothetical protein